MKTTIWQVTESNTRLIKKNKIKKTKNNYRIVSKISSTNNYLCTRTSVFGSSLTPVVLDCTLLQVSELRQSYTPCFLSYISFQVPELRQNKVALFHDVRSSNSRSNNARFMNKLCLSLHVTNRLTQGETAYIGSEIHWLFESGLIPFC